MSARLFSGTQRIEMFLKQDGLCARCGRELDAGWEADHDIPWSADGPTEEWNGQALCAGCNRSKGATTDLRAWQARAVAAYMRSLHTQDDFLLVATPGAGKTRVAVAAARKLLDDGAVLHVIVAVPTQTLKTQWAAALARGGIEVDPAFANRHGLWSDDYQGAAVTYAQVASEPRIFERLCSRAGTLVILDEIHHCGDSREWGDGVRRAFSPARRRLLLSGTPFRSDSNSIPFVRYTDGEGRADFHYGYDQALADGVVRPVYFWRRGGLMEWQSSDGQALAASFDEELDERAASERLRTALDPRGDWFRAVIAEASARLSEMRASDADAAGLVIAMDIGHATAIASTMERVIGRRPVLVTSDDDDAPRVIERFTSGSDPWIVAVKMVSEGIDIPRLRVGVYATNTTTELFFRQAVGRTVRVDGDEGQSADFYIPDDPRLRKWAEEILKMREHQLDEEIERLLKPRDGSSELPLSAFMPISSTVDDRGVIVGQDTITPDEIIRARDLINSTPSAASYSPAVVAQLLRKLSPQTAETTSQPESVVPKYRAKASLRKVNHHIVAKIAKATGLDHSLINQRLNDLVGIRRIEEATEDQLRARLEQANAMLRTAR